LLQLLSKWCELAMQEFTLHLPASDGKTLAYCHEHGRVVEQKLEGDQLILTVHMSPRYASKILAAE